jgi:hypothetical protein
MVADLIKSVVPSRESLEYVTRRYPNETADVQYELAQSDTLLRLSRARDFDHMVLMARAGQLDHLVAAHNEMALRSAS